MRALFVINNPVFGGAHNELLGQRAGLARAGWETLALTSDEPATGQDRLRAAGVEVVAMPLHRLRASRDPRLHLALLARLAPEVRAIRRVIRERGIDVVQVHGPTNLHGALAARREGVALCWHIYDEVAPPPLLKVLMPLVRRMADSVTTIGGALADSHGVRGLGPRCVVTSPPVDLTRFRPDPAARAAARAELGIPEDAIAIGTVGNRNPTKGHLDLVAAAARLIAEDPRVVVRIMGARSPVHADYERAIHEAIAARGLGDRVRLLEPAARVAELMPGLDIYTMTSVPRSEGMPTAILEAMGCALPVVATDVGAVAEEVEEGVTGFVVPPLDVDAVTGTLLELVRSPELRARLGAAGRERALRLFDVPVVVANRLRAYEAALDHCRARA